MTIFPEQSEIKAVAKLLLELADHPRQVTTTLDPTVGFIVPEWLYELFVQVWDTKLGNVGRDVIPAAEIVSEPNETIEPVARRKPGRPRKES